MKKSSLLIIALLGIISCSQDDDSFPNTDHGSDYLSETLYRKGGAEPKDSLVVPPPTQNEVEGNPPPKDMSGNGGKPSPNGSINANIK